MVTSQSTHATYPNEQDGGRHNMKFWRGFSAGKGFLFLLGLATCLRAETGIPQQYPTVKLFKRHDINLQPNGMYEKSEKCIASFPYVD